MVDLLQLRNRNVLFECVAVPVAQNKSSCGNDRKSGAVVLICAHHILIGDRIFVNIVDMEWKLDQDLIHRNRNVLFECVAVPVAQNKSFCGNDCKSGAVVLICAHHILIGD